MLSGGEAATGQTPIGQCPLHGERKRETWPFTRLAKPSTNTACCTVVGPTLAGFYPAAAPNSHPTPAVTPIAKAPQKDTRRIDG